MNFKVSYILAKLMVLFYHSYQLQFIEAGRWFPINYM